MIHVKIENGVAVQPYPYTLYDLKADHPGTSFPKGIWPTDLDTFNVVEVVPTTAPVPTATQTVAEALPALIGNVWTQQWTVRDWTTKKIADAQAAEAERARLAEIDATISGDSQIAMLKAKTAAEYATWFSGLTTNQKLEFMMRISRVVVRRVL